MQRWLSVDSHRIEHMIETTEQGTQAQTSAADRAWSGADLHALADDIAAIDGVALPIDLLDQLDALERVKSAAAAAQVVVAAAFADVVEAAENITAHGHRRPRRAMSIGAEVALATRTSPYQGEQRVLLSRRLRDDLPGVHAALGRGDVNEERALAVARAVSHLDPAQRRQVDDDVSGRADLAAMGDERLRQAVRRSCLTVGAEAEGRRHRRARADRHVTTRQLDDGTGRVTAIVAAEHLAAVRAALDAAAASARASGDERTGGQVRADTMVERITGRDPVAPVPTRVNLVIAAESLIDGAEPGHVPGVGWLPAGLCRELVRHASAAAKATLRRLFVRPDDRTLVSMESTSRTFPTALAELLDLRDGGLCRTPGCNAPVRHHDHVVRASDGGRTSATNGQGLCERCNYVKESPGWVFWIPTGGDGPHQVHGATEHLRILRSQAPPLPGRRDTRFSPAELRLAQVLTIAA